MKTSGKVVRVMRNILLVASPLALLGGCGSENDALDASNRTMSFEEFRAQAYRDPDTGIYVVDGDMLAVNEARLRELYRIHLSDRSSQRNGPNEPGIVTTRNPLAVLHTNGVDDRWDVERQLNITYCVDKKYFHVRYEEVVQAMAEAASAWQRAASVAFHHVSEEDDRCDAYNRNVTFDVRPLYSDDGYYAMAFFPLDPPEFRHLIIRVPYGLTGSLTLAGVLRHELGHVLGFVHENARTGQKDCFGSSPHRALTPYDSASVMHLRFCEGSTAKGDWVLSSLDEQGAAAFYGPPADAGLDVVFYRTSYPDLQTTFGDDYAAIRNHWVNVGLRDGRRGSAHFDAKHYLSIYPELAATLGAENYFAAWEHWLNTGVAEGRRGSREFDVRYYLDNNPDLQTKFGTDYTAALSHWLVTGLFEGRRGSADFDAKYYLSNNADLQTGLGATNYPAALAHWLRTGMKEGRRGAP